MASLVLETVSRPQNLKTARTGLGTSSITSLQALHDRPKCAHSCATTISVKASVAVAPRYGARIRSFVSADRKLVRAHLEVGIEVDLVAVA